MNQKSLPPSTTAALRACLLASIGILHTAHGASGVVVEETTANRDQALVQPNPIAYDREAERLRAEPLQDYVMERAVLSDVLRALATDAKLNYIALDEGAESDNTLVTIHLKQSPFTALETVANHFGVALILDGGVWFMRPFDDKQVLGRNYRLNFNLTEEVDFGSTGSEALSAGGGGGGGASSSGGGGGSGGSGGSGEIGVRSSGGDMVSKKADTLMDNLKAILNIPTHGYEARVEGEVSVADFGKNKLMVPLKGGVESDTAIENKKSDSKQGKAAVAWNSDSNSFFVVATRQQHQLVEAYLNSFDKKQYLLGVEIKFYETSRDPRSQMGVDWSSWGEGGISLAPQGTELFNKVTTPFLNVLAPHSMILDASKMAAKLQFLSRDSAGKFTSYPRVVTLNNRPVQIKSVVNQPILSSTSSVNSTIGGTSTQSVQYLPIGTSIAVVPKRMEGDKVNLHLKLTVSTIAGTEFVGGNKYPITSTRSFQNQTIVDNGYTVAIAGLDEALDTQEGTGIPILSKIPFAGWAFKNKVHDTTKKNMMIFITPTILDSNGNGVGMSPVSELPRFKGDLPRNAPQIYTDGSLIGGPKKMGEAVLWVDQSVRKISEILTEGRAEPAHREELSRLDDVVQALTNYLPACQQSLSPERVSLMHGQLNGLANRISTLKSCYRQNHVNGLGYSEKCDR